MARRKPEAKFYVYRIYNGVTTVYIGKGCGYRLTNQMRRFGLPGEKIEEGLTEAKAFEREVHWIATLNPTDNKNAGGRGGRSNRRVAYADKETIQIQVVGSRRYCARLLLSKINEEVKIRLGLSNLDLNRLREVANGPRC